MSNADPEDIAVPSELSSTVSQQLLWELPVLDLGSLAPIALFLEAQQPPPSGQTIHSTPSVSQGLPEPGDWFGPLFAQSWRPPTATMPSRSGLIWPSCPAAPAEHCRLSPTPMPQGLLTCLLCPQFSLFLVLASSTVGDWRRKRRSYSLQWVLWPLFPLPCLVSFLVLQPLSECSEVWFPPLSGLTSPAHDHVVFA